MARGRAFDSDASGSGSRGDRGPGRIAHGRGGSIPHPSSGTSRASSFAQRPVLPPSHPSSGTSGASSSAQCPVLPPSQPSAPSSSTPSSSTPIFYPRFWTSTDSTSCTVTYCASIYPSSRAARQILKIIKLQLHKEGYTWDAVPQEARDFYWEEFQPEHTDSHYDEDIRAQLADQQRQIAELRAHVMRLSVEPAANTGSSSQCCRRYTLVTPPGATSPPAGTPPGDLTSGDPTSDPADEQQHRFDFGPF
ncbi:hypothetical protein JCGZ_10583 [Jatropha curcas]|uniref:Uncharacterized protein n=1 Tax=Jatropha curcas TaxID=180498 RepID=A0A067KII9_JATCU|nr:hypothetical protein JCGZ_10583 [Jatropha curcas]